MSGTPKPKKRSRGTPTEQRLNKLRKSIGAIVKESSRMSVQYARIRKESSDAANVIERMCEDVLGNGSGGGLLDPSTKRQKTSVDEEKLRARERQLEFYINEVKARSKQAEDMMKNAVRMMDDNNKMREKLILTRDCGEPIPDKSVLPVDLKVKVEEHEYELAE